MELKSRSLGNILKDTRNTLNQHKETFPNEAQDIDKLISKIPKGKVSSGTIVVLV